MAKNNPYYKITESTSNESLEAAILLIAEEYIELPSGGDDEIADQLFIDTNARLFWFLDRNAMKATERIIRMKYGFKVQNVTSPTILTELTIESN